MAQWEKIAPTLSPDGESKLTLPLEKARIYLQRFQKPGGFEAKKHVSTLLALLKSPLVSSDRAAVQAVLQNVALSSPVLLREILAENPKLLGTLISKTPAKACRNKNDEKALLEGARNYVSISLALSSKSKFSDWEELSLLSPLLSQLSTAQKEEQIDLVAQRLADGAADTPKYSGIFLSKLYKFAYQAVVPFYGEPVKPITDITMVREQNKVIPFILGAGRVETDGKQISVDTTFGFSMTELPPIKLSAKKSGEPVFNGRIPWRVNGEKYESQIKISALGAIKALIPDDKAPKYDQLWADGALTGVVVTGSNLGSLSVGVTNEYRAFFVDQGFEFPDPPALKTVALGDYLKNGVTQGDFDYFIKEAHSDGDEKNLFRIDATAKVETGVREFVDPITKQKRKEIIHIVFPDAGTSETALIRNQTFGEWIRAREKNPNAKNGQLVYFNTSCWSKTKAIHEIEAAGTDTLLNIPTLTSTLVFANHLKNAEYLLLTAFREGKNFSAMREELGKNPGYQSKDENRFIFPDEDDYKTNITDLFQFPIKMDVKITDSKGSEYNIDQGH